MKIKIFWITLFLLVCACTLSKKKAHSQIIETQAIHSIVGEGRGEFGMDWNKKLFAMTALAEAMRNKNNLKGVYGLTYDQKAELKRMQDGCRKKFKGKSLNWCLDLAPKTMAKINKLYYETAKQAWKNSRSTNITKGATVWGTDEDIKIFKRTRWFKSYEKTVTIGTHTFFKLKDSK